MEEINLHKRIENIGQSIIGLEIVQRKQKRIKVLIYISILVYIIGLFVLYTREFSVVLI